MRSREFRRVTNGLNYTVHGRSGWARYYETVVPDLNHRRLRAYSVEYLSLVVQRAREEQARTPRATSTVLTINSINQQGVRLI